MSDKKLDKEFWNSRYKNDQTGWDLGEVSPPIKHFIDQLQNKDQRILIPGAGNAYELGYLLEKGFKNVSIIDIAPKLIDRLNKNYGHTDAMIIEGDFFDWQKKYDLILEQTFFCAINPSRRDEYVKHMYDLLAPQGKLCGVLFDREFEGGPPFGGSISEYEDRFNDLFVIKKLERCKNSHSARHGNEAWIELIKR